MLKTIPTLDDLNPMDLPANLVRWPWSE